eukprot:NODE_160_length_16633_cov_0.230132.p3 type:complete len:373 gc:universal NODE_160_length_16633_cov_0.230132:10684-9566(-)
MIRAKSRCRTLDFTKLLGQRKDSDPNRLVKMGIISKYSAGYFTFLPLGMMLLEKIKNIIKMELEGINALEIALPLVSKKAHWDVSQRSEIYKKEFIHLDDGEYILPPTSEEDISQLLSYNTSTNQLPLYYYQMQWKFRNELRCRKELLRTRQFLMNDLYSFDLNTDAAALSYKRVSESYQKIFERLELPFIRVESDPSDMKGLFSHEYLILHPEGEAEVYINEDGYNLVKDGAKMNAIEAAHTFLIGDYFTKLFTNKLEMKSPIMGCYGIGVTRLLSILSLSHKYFPKSVAPVTAVVIDLGCHFKDAKNSIESYLQTNNGDVLGFVHKPRNLKSSIEDIQNSGIEDVIILGSKYKSKKQIEHITDTKINIFE